MWDAISGVLTSGNGPSVLLFIFLIAAVAVMLVATGKLKISTRHLSIGVAADERRVLREQAKWLHTYCSSREQELLKFAQEHGVSELEYGGYFAKYICERVYDVCLNWIMLNHITDDKAYMELKKSEVRSLVQALGPADIFISKEFYDILSGWTEHVIEQLLNIRRLYGQKKYREE